MLDGISSGLEHIEGKRLQPIARKLNIPYADAVVGFDSYKRMSKAITHGIVVASADAEAIREEIVQRKRRNPPELAEKKRLRALRKQEEEEKAFHNEILALFPAIPGDEAAEIVNRAMQKGRVGRSESSRTPDKVGFNRPL